MAADIKQFAEKRSLKAKQDSCGDTFIPAKSFCYDTVATVKKRIAKGIKRDPKEYSSHIYDGFTDGRLGLCLMFPHKKRWNSSHRQMLAAGFTQQQAGDSGGCYKFDPGNTAHVKLALSLAGIKRKKQISPAQVAALAKGRAQFVRTEEKPALIGSVCTQSAENESEAA
jgi:hypothetical protein